MSENFIGEIRLFAGNYAPQSWAFCNGQTLSISGNEALFTLIGTTYGGDGQTNFKLPDLRGRLPVGQGNGAGLSARPIGSLGGEETHTLAAAEIPAHAHTVSATTAGATTITPGPAVLYGAVTPDTTNGITGLYTAQVPPTATAAQMAAQAVTGTGGGQPHDNTMATLTINFIIALQGLFPSRQ